MVAEARQLKETIFRKPVTITSLSLITNVVSNTTLVHHIVSVIMHKQGSE